MSRNGSGTYSLPSPQYPVVAGTVIYAATANTIWSDIATALTGSIAANGETPITANIPFSDFKITGLGNPSALTDAMNVRAGIYQIGVYSSVVGGTADAITLTPSPAIISYAAGQRFVFIAGGTNTGAVTVAVSGLSAKDVRKRGTTALVAGDIVSGAMTTIQYDGTNFQLVTPHDTGRKNVAETISGDWTFTGTTTISAALPVLEFSETDQAANEKRARFRLNTKVWSFQFVSDDGATTTNAFAATRGTGTVLSTCTIGNTTDNPTVQVYATELDIRQTTFNASSTIRSGTYTPTLTNVANCAALVSAICMYTRIGKVVTVFGRVNCDPTSAATITRFRCSLPVTSTLSAGADDLAGTAVDAATSGAGTMEGWRIFGDGTNDEAEFRNESISGTAARDLQFSFTYNVT